MTHLFRTFLLDEDGVVSTDWIVITAAVVGFAIGVFTFFETETGTILSAVDGQMGTQDAASSF
jgi:Flp pilus assembly pilin Flp